jgi:hypothetical protein
LRVRECSAEAVADSGDLVDTTPGSVGPVAGSYTPILAGRARVARDEVEVKVGHFITEHEAVDVLCALAVLQRAAEVVDQHPQSGSFSVGQLPQAGDVALGHNHQVSEVHVGQVGRENVTGIHEVVFINDPARYYRPLGVFITDEAVHARQALTSLSLEGTLCASSRNPLSLPALRGADIAQ